MRGKRSRNEGEAAGWTWVQTSEASLLPPLCDRKLEAEGRALQTSEASLRIYLNDNIEKNQNFAAICV